MANALIELLRPHPLILLIAVAADLAIGDPVYPLHPIRLMGRTLTALENILRRLGFDGYIGGVVLFLKLAVIWLGVTTLIVFGLARVNGAAAWFAHAFFVYSFLALGDLVRHVWRVEQAVNAGDISAARTRISALVGRDVDRMDGAACRRAAIESLSENLTDGFTSPLFWYALIGLPGLVLFKVVSTMDSMVGYKTPRYLQFGWCGARLDDVMNYVPARLTWLLIGGVAVVLPECSGIKALRVGLKQHAILLGPNSGWSEAATAGGIQRRIVGPIWNKGMLVTDVWIGDPADAPVETRSDLIRGVMLAVVSGLTAVGLAVAGLMAGAS